MTTQIRSAKHREFIASLPCLISGATNVQCCHIRTGNPCGTGLKPGDDCCVPLSVEEHDKQHHVGEIQYWSKWGGPAQATKLAKLLYENTGDKEKCIELMGKFILWQIL